MAATDVQAMLRHQGSRVRVVSEPIDAAPRRFPLQRVWQFVEIKKLLSRFVDDEYGIDFGPANVMMLDGLED
jgi:hypothetical protein